MLISGQAAPQLPNRVQQRGLRVDAQKEATSPGEPGTIAANCLVVGTLQAAWGVLGVLEGHAGPEDSCCPSNPLVPGDACP